MRTSPLPRRRPATPGRCLAAGAAAGAVAAAADRALLALAHARLPSPAATVGSALVAGVLGGALYWLLSRGARRPAAWLWALSLALATADSLLIARVPLAPGGAGSLAFMAGLVAPAKQVLGLAGLVRLGTRHFPAAALGVDAAVHYLTAAAVSLLVPRWAGRRRW